MKITVLVKQVPDPEAVVEVETGGKGLMIEQKFTTNLFDDYAKKESVSAVPHICAISGRLR
jgi:electron transfer flavoprotein alpha/beta subunit